MSEAEEMLKYYGVVIPDRKFHISPLCPSLRTIRNWKQGEVNTYDKQTDAIMMGHLKRCPVCFNMYRFQVRVEGVTQEFLLDKSEIDILVGMAELQKQSVSITVTGIAVYSKLEPQVVNDTLKRLRKMKLIAQAEFNGDKQLRGKRKFTPMGAAVVLAYANKLYGAPLSDQGDLPAGLEKINNRLV